MLMNTPDHPRTSFQSFLQTVRKLDQTELYKLAAETEMMLEAIENAVFLVGLDQSGQYIYLRNNTSYTELTGLSLAGRGPTDVFGPVEGAEMYLRYQQCLSADTTLSYERTLVTEGNTRYFQVSLVPMYSADKAEFIVGIYYEITAFRKVEESLRHERNLLRTTLLSVGESIVVTDQTGLIVLINPMACELSGWSGEDAIGQPVDRIIHLVHEITRENFRAMFSQIMISGQPMQLQEDTLLINPAGQELPVAVLISPIKQETGFPTGMVLVIRNIAQEKKRQAAISYLSYHDQLTGLYNRHFFDAERQRLDRPRNLPIALIMADVNGLKLMNDAFGHQAGDRLLQQAAEAIRSVCRQDEIIARLGGDEFIIILPETDAAGAALIIRRIQKQCSEIQVESITLSIAFGFSVKTSTKQSLDMVFKEAEDHMYRQKLLDSSSIRSHRIENAVASLYQNHPQEKQHAERVAKLCLFMGHLLNLPEGELTDLETTSLLHDIGKIAIADAILSKQGMLTKAEWEEIHRHPEIGYRIMSTANELADLADLVLSHHERWDGKGYPRGLKGDQIPLTSRIIALAEAFDAMTGVTYYRDQVNRQQAMNELRKSAGTQFDPELVELFIKNFIEDTIQ